MAMAAFSSLWIFVFFSLLLCLEATLNGSQPYRTSYHFQPRQNWMNDPNGPMIYKGMYHLFYQYNPNGAVWGNMVWGHSASTDLINWVPLELAIYPSQPADINGCWSGSATILAEGKPAILYTGINSQNNQVQNLALPKNDLDPFLREWVKLPQNPLMQPTPQNGISRTSFRDPTTAWVGPDKTWRVIIGSEGLAILFRSKDFLNWVQADRPLHSVPNSGMWECPDFFPVLVNSQVGVDTSYKGPHTKHVLKTSLSAQHDHYTIGTYNLDGDVFTPDSGSVEGSNSLRLDYGKFYASKSFFDSAKTRRILWGWIRESSSEDDDIKKGWSGLQSIPRTIWLDASGKQLLQWPIVEIQKLRRKHVKLPRTELGSGKVIQINGVSAAQADVEVSFKVTSWERVEAFDPNWTDPQQLCSQKGATVQGGVGPFGLHALASNALEEYTAVFFRLFKASQNYVVLMCSDQSRSSLNQNNDKTTYGTFLNVDPVREDLSLRILIDRSIVESFGGRGKGCITSRVYPTLAIGEAANLFAFNYGSQSVNITKLNAWSMTDAKIN